MGASKAFPSFFLHLVIISQSVRVDCLSFQCSLVILVAKRYCCPFFVITIRELRTGSRKYFGIVNSSMKFLGKVRKYNTEHLKISHQLALLTVATTLLLLPATLASVSYAQSSTTPFAGRTFPPQLMGKLSGAPSYVISIVENNNQVSFNPPVANIPVGMTVVWFNNGEGGHSVVTLNTDNYSPPQTIGSGVLAPGGSFVYTFTEPGVYNYTDSSFPGAKGVISVGDATESGDNFSMHVGGDNALPFDPHKPDNSMVLRFVPTTVSIPPTTDLTYNVTISDPKGTLITQQFTDSDGILDLELSSSGAATSAIGNATTNASTVGQFTTWGPDFIGEQGVNSDGTFHIQGPILNENTQYSIKVTMLSKDNSPLANVTDTFVLMPKP
jgi:plastocyanin